ncbi:Hypothetical protein A7982_06492 [Minicystis rosea]|nr:Hypothetical protein A7982_06492 [Minicystis rosea]
MSAPFLIYGATGYTGRLLACAALERGMRPILGAATKRVSPRSAARSGSPIARPASIAGSRNPSVTSRWW